MVRWTEDSSLPDLEVERPGSYARLVAQDLRHESETGPGLLEIGVDEEVAQAIREELFQEYSTEDPVKIIEKMRNRE